MTTTPLYDDLLAELERSLVVDDNTKEYWIQNYQKLPVTAVRYFFEHLRKEDAKVERLVMAGLEIHPEIAQAISQKTKDVKKRFMKINEKNSQIEENPDAFLEQNLP